MVEDVCKLCGLKSNVKINKIVYCKECFNKHLSQKITKNIGKLKMGSKIFIHFDGSVSSFAMMYLLGEYKNKKLYKFYISKAYGFKFQDFFSTLNLDLNFISDLRDTSLSSSTYIENGHSQENKEKDSTYMIKGLNIQPNLINGDFKSTFSKDLPDEKALNFVSSKNNVSLVLDIINCIENGFDAVINVFSMDNIAKLFLRNIINGNGSSYFKEVDYCNNNFKPFFDESSFHKSTEEVFFENKEKLFSLDRELYNSMVENTLLDNLSIINLFRGIKNKEVQSYISQIRDFSVASFKSFPLDKIDEKLSKFILEVDTNNSLVLFNVINTYRKI